MSLSASTSKSSLLTGLPPVNLNTPSLTVGQSLLAPVPADVFNSSKAQSVTPTLAGKAGITGLTYPLKPVFANTPTTQPTLKAQAGEIYSRLFIAISQLLVLLKREATVGMIQGRRKLDTLLTKAKYALGLMICIVPTPGPVKEAVTRMVFYSPPGYCDISELKNETLKNKMDQMIMSDFKNGFHLNAWHLPAQKGQPTVLLYHGRNNTIRDLEPLMEPFMEKGYGIFAADPPGFGNSKGRLTEENLYKAGLFTSEYLRDRLHVPVSEQILLGHSLGGAVALKTAGVLSTNGEKPRALILASTFTTIKEAFMDARNKVSVRFRDLLDDNRIAVTFPSKTNIAQLNGVPTLVLHGDKDLHIPAYHGQALRNAASNAPGMKDIACDFQLIEKGGHGLHKGSLAAGIVTETEKFLLKIASHV